MNGAALAILRYLAGHPAANDTFQGVSDWWLLEESTPRPRAEIQDALQELVAEGLVCETRGGDGQIRYRLCPGKLAAIQERFRR